MPSDFQLKGMNTIHRALLKLSGGRLGHSAMGMPVLELHTVGRRSGKPRASMLTSPVQTDGNYLIVASKGGEPTHPGWYHNLVANPDVEIVVRGERKPVRARTLSPEEKAKLWPKVTAAYKGYAGYQKKTTRDIPLVVLEPR